MSELIVDNDFIQAGVAFDDESRVEFETLTSDVDAAIISLILEIKELKPQAQQSEWVSVADSLPDDVEVLFYIPMIGQIELGKLNKTTEQWMMAHRDNQYPLNMATHWIPLPTPPKGE